MSDNDGRRPTTYRDAGVDIDAGARAVEGIRDAVKSTYRPEVIGDIGGFGGLFSAAAFKDMDEPVLVSATDGVGTKLAVAQLVERFDTVGVDLVAMCVNDLIVSGAEPLFFLDYVAVGKLDPERMADIVGGVAAGCRLAECSLVGGEMAEHPGTMPAEDFDMSGFAVGVVDRAKIVDGSTIEPGDVVLGLASSGLHSNGYSLVRRVLVEGHESELDLRRVDLGGTTLGEALLEPTRIYVRAVKALIAAGLTPKGMAHITGGGITENLDRTLPKTVDARVHAGAWPVPKVIEAAVNAAGLGQAEAYKTFNMGLGFMLVFSPADAAKAAAVLREAGETPYEVGAIIEGSGKVVYGG